MIIATTSEEVGRLMRSLYKFNIEEIDIGQVVKQRLELNDSNKGCSYVFARGVNKGDECQKPVKQGSRYCVFCETRKKNTVKTESKLPLCFALKWKETKDLSFFRDNHSFTDITLIVSGVSFHAHKLILATASPYFEALLLSGFKEASDNCIVLKGITCEVFRLYIDLMYGKEVTINNWRNAFDLFDYLKLTLVNWNKDSTATLFHVPPEEYVEYIKRLYLLYDDDVPRWLIEETGKYITSTLDLSEFDPAFMQLIRPTTMKLNVYDVGNGYFREITKGLIIRYETCGYYCLGYAPKELLLSSFSLDSVVSLTTELKKYCDSLGIRHA